MYNLVRTQLLLRDDQRAALELIARETNTSLSEVAREFIDAQLSQFKYRKMREAAALLKSDYEKGGAQDGEDFDEA